MQEIKLEEIAEVLTGYPFRTKVESIADGDLCVIQGKDIRPDRSFDPKKLTRIRLKASARPGKKMLKKDDVIFMTRSEHPYAVHIVHDMPPAIVQNSFNTLRLRDSAEMLPAFLGMILNQSLMRARVAAIIKGTSIPYIRVQDLREVSVPVPSMEKQRTLVALAQAQRQERDLHRELEQTRQQQLDGLVFKS